MDINKILSGISDIEKFLKKNLTIDEFVMLSEIFISCLYYLEDKKDVDLEYIKQIRIFADKFFMCYNTAYYYDKREEYFKTEI